MRSKKEVIKKILMVGILVIFLFSIYSCDRQAEETKKTRRVFRQQVQEEKGPCDEYDVLTLKDLCYFNIAISNESAETCENIGNGTTKSTCFALLASMNNDEDLCDMIADYEERVKCIFNLMIGREDSSSCEKIPEKTGKYSRNRCYMFFAMNSKDSSLCGNIVDEESLTGEKCLEILSP